MLTSLALASISSCLPLTSASMPFWVESSALSLPRTLLCSVLSPSCKEITNYRGHKEPTSNPQILGDILKL